MSRGTVPGLSSPYRIAEFLPSVYQEDDPFIQRFTAGLDEVLAPVLSTLDCMEAYVDPHLTPEDFLGWLGSWVGAVVDEETPLALRRAAVAHAAALHRSRGTLGGLQALVELLTGGLVDQAGEQTLSAMRMAVEAAVAAAKPAHVAHSVEVVSR